LTQGVASGTLLVMAHQSFDVPLETYLVPPRRGRKGYRRGGPRKGFRWAALQAMREVPELADYSQAMDIAVVGAMVRWTTHQILYACRKHHWPYYSGSGAQRSRLPLDTARKVVVYRMRGTR